MRGKSLLTKFTVDACCNNGGRDVIGPVGAGIIIFDAILKCRSRRKRGSGYGSSLGT